MSIRRVGSTCTRAVIACTATFAVAIAGCSTTPEHLPYKLDCSAENAYDIKVLESYETKSLSENPTWYSYGDTTPRSFQTSNPDSGGPFPTQPIENGGRCGSQRALVLETYGHTDYGSGFGDYHPGTNYTYVPSAYSDDYEGISFWARTPPFEVNGKDTPSTHGMTLWLSDGTSATVAGDAGHCTDYGAEAGGPLMIDQFGNVIGSVNGIPADACGNNFERTLVTEDKWQFYTLPFSSFHQLAQANRSPAGFDHALFIFGLRFPKEAMSQLWIDDFGFYRAARGAKGAKVLADRACMKVQPDSADGTAVITDFVTPCKQADGGLTGHNCFGGPNGSGIAGGTYGFGGKGEDITTNHYCPVYFSKSTFQGLIEPLSSSGGVATTDASVGTEAGSNAGANAGDGGSVSKGLHLQGDVSGFAGGGMYLGHCLDASEFSGVEFTISGYNAAPNPVSQGIQLQVTEREQNSLVNGGTCDPDPDASTYGNCAPAALTVPLSTDPNAPTLPQTIKVRWSDLSGGKPAPAHAAIDDPAQLGQIQWQFNYNCGMDPPFAVDVWISDVKFFK